MCQKESRSSLSQRAAEQPMQWVKKQEQGSCTGTQLSRGNHCQSKPKKKKSQRKWKYGICAGFWFDLRGHKAKRSHGRFKKIGRWKSPRTKVPRIGCPPCPWKPMVSPWQKDHSETLFVSDMAGHHHTCHFSALVENHLTRTMLSLVALADIYTIMRHNEIRDLTASLLGEVCGDVQIEPTLIPLSGEAQLGKSANTSSEDRMDVSARGFWGDRFVRTMFECSDFPPKCPLCAHSSSQQPVCEAREGKETAL